MSPTKLTIPPTQRQVLDHLIASTPSPRTRRRAEAIQRLHNGYSLHAAAEAAGVSVKTARAWLRHFQADGLEGLTDRPRSGRPRKVTDEAIDLLEALLVERPSDFDYDEAVGWTVPLLRDCLERRTGIALSDGRMRVLLHRLGYRYQEQPSLLQEMMPPFPDTYEDMRAWLLMEDTLRARLPEQQCRPVRTWVKVED